MGIVSGAALDAGGDVVGVIPHVMLASGGEGDRVPGNGCSSVFVKLGEEGRDMVSVTRLHDTPVAELDLRWNGCDNPSNTLTILTYADFGPGGCGLNARA